MTEKSKLDLGAGYFFQTDHLIHKGAFIDNPIRK